MKMLDFRQRLLVSTLIVGTGSLANPAFAQTTSGSAQDQNSTANPAATQPTGPVEAAPAPGTNAQGAPTQGSQDIIITGTRIPQPNLTSAAPITVVTNQDVKLSGSTRIEDVLNQLPSVGASMTSGMSNGATGTAEVDLRYLGSKRTLSLVNGRRMTPGDPAGASQAANSGRSDNPNRPRRSRSRRAWSSARPFACSGRCLSTGRFGWPPES
jgi:outer membrane receptor for ferrienterochelin and colicin